MEGKTKRLRPIVRAAVLAAALAAACSGPEPDNHPPPGLVVLTPRPSVAAGGHGAVLLRADQPSRVSLWCEGELLGTGRAGRDVGSLRFDAPEWVLSNGNGATRAATVIAVSAGGMSEQVEVVLTGLVPVDTQTADVEFLDVAAVNTSAAFRTANQVWFTTRGDAAPHVISSIAGPIQAIATADAWNGVLVAGRDASVGIYVVSGGDLQAEPTRVFEFADYDGSTRPVDRINALHADGLLIAAATDDGMAILDGAVVEDGEFCRKRSAMTTRLSPATYEGAMDAVVVLSPTERVVAGGAYLNVYEAYDDTDPGGCEPGQIMANRGTSVVAPPDDASLPWSTVAMATTTTNIWIGRYDGGIVRIPRDFVLLESRYFRDEDLRVLAPASLPLPLVVDVSGAPRDRAWVALGDSDGLNGGLLRLSNEGPDLWVDASVLGGLPIAVDVSPDSSQVWVITTETIAVFTDPG